ncbi:conserved Plasmodium protein, unknown function [Plasmodium vinckei vinckei]|uniref:Uncharacterized protein n=1 Tax=Plasmodium vinckei vinckei TaxID=54757 RepID=A0A081I9F9_PLAVN|nr:conserved Plasmodium protein, unknown function [Plasmodium vinckei vinckei]KEG00317.1 hypothetical protein YYE_04828 [Plasmodium vinckei vinckei]VEV54469.1 conserved Plasmodium protein, unknown function [Plasmodium vinckei vinckei]
MNSRFLLFLFFLKFCFCYIKNINRFTNSSFSILKSEKDQAQNRKKNKLIYLNNTTNSTYGNKNTLKNGSINNIGSVENITDNFSCDENKNISTKFLNANKEEDYNDLYFYHIFKKINIIKKNKYIYSPAKYESIRSYIKRELNDCLDINTTSYIFKLSEYFPKNILEASVYVNEVINILSFFTFNNVNNVNQIASCHTDLGIDNTKEEKNKLNEDLKDLSEHVNINNNDTNISGGIINTHISSNALMDNNHMNSVHNFMNKSAENYQNLSSVDQNNLYDEEKIQMIKESYINKLKGNSEDTSISCNSHGDADNSSNITSDSKDEDLLISTHKKKDGTKISKVISKDTNYKSFSYFFFRLVDAISGLFCCIGKRSKREEIYNYLKNFKSIEKIKNYSITDINFNTDFMIYIIRLTKYKHDNFICSLKKLKMYDTETIKKIFLSSVYDNILDLEYIKNLEHEYIIKESKGERLPNKIFNGLTETKNIDNNVKTSQNFDQTGNVISQNISQTNLTQIEKKYKFLLEKKLEEQSTKKDVPKINDGDLKNLIKDIIGKHVFPKNSAPSKDKKKKKMKNDNKLLPVYIHEVEETQIMEILKQNKYSHIDLDSITIKNLIKKMNTLLRSYDINITVQVKKENTSISDEKIINSSEGNKKMPEQSNTNMESEQNNEKIKQDESETEKTKTDLRVDLSDITLSEVKDYIHDNEKNEKNEIENINDDVHIGQNSDIPEKDVLKYFDVTENKNSIIFEINDYILENENKSAQKQVGESIKFGSVEKLDENNLNQIEEELANEQEKKDSTGTEQNKNGGPDINLSKEVEAEEEMEVEAEEEMDDEAEEEMDDEAEEEMDDEAEEEMDDEIDEAVEDEREETEEVGKVRRIKKKKKINKENKEIENLKMYFRYIDNNKLKYNFENVYGKNMEEKIELLLFILKNENKKKIIISTDEKETELIKMKCKIEKVEYEDIVSTLKNIKYYFAKNINANNSCFVFMNEIENTLVLRKMFGKLRESKDEERKITIYHFYNSEHKSLVLKKLFYSITNDEDSYSKYLGKPKNKNSQTRDTEKGGPIPGRTSERNIKAHTFEKYNNKKNDEIKKRGKKKLKPSEKNWLAFRRRTLKKIDEMKKKAELIKKKKTEKRDKKVKRVIEKLKSKERKRAEKLAKKTNKQKKVK